MVATSTATGGFVVSTDEVGPRDRSAETRFFCASSLTASQITRWREFAESVPLAHYSQDPVWAEIEREAGSGSRRPIFFWTERDGSFRLTAVGLRRSLPMPRRAFWEFPKGPTFLEAEALDEWLPWLRARLGREAARLRMAPSMPLSPTGDDVETILEIHGFTRRRVLGGWATLVGDLRADDEQILRACRPATQRSIRKSLRLGIEVLVEDDPEGWAVLAGLETELARGTPVNRVDPAKIERISRLWLKNGAGGTVLVARHAGEPLAAALVIKHRETAYLPMIPSARRQRHLPASHLLVWEAMRWAKHHGSTAFDFAGYSLVARPGDSLWGINQFKRGFATLDSVQKSVAVHERVQSPWLATSAQAIREAQARWRRSEGATPRGVT